MTKAGRRALCLLVGALALVWAVPAVAQGDLTEREKDLLIVIDSLQERVEQLEDRMDGVGPTVVAPDYGDRIEAIELKLEEEEEMAANDFRVFWKDSLRFETADGNFKLRIGGRMQTDFVWYDQNEESKLPINTNNFPPTWTRDLEDGVEFRRARLYISGSVYDNIKFKWQYDFAQQDDDDDTEFKDVYVALTDLPVVGTLKIGHFKEPFSLEELTSSKNVTFMERALPNVYAPGRNTGFQLQNAFLDERLTAAVGVFRETNSWGFYADDDAGWNVTGRITGLPWYADEGRQLLHLGAAYSHKNPDDFGLRYRQRPEAHLSGIRFVDTAFQNPFPGAARVDSVNLYGGEAALVYGPFSVQGEYMMHDVDTDYSLGDLDFDGWYVETSYYLTGEHRRYDTGDGTFDSVKPLNNFSLDGSGWGAWQVALRYSTVDFNDGWVVRGGEETNWTAGINWWLNPATRVTFNYVKADIEHDLYEGDLDIFQTRFQFAF